MSIDEDLNIKVRELYLELKSFRKVSRALEGRISKDKVGDIMNTFYPSIVERKPTLDFPNYFSVIDSPEKAYILGFIAADGYISKPCFKNRFLEITLNRRDIGTLEFIKEELGASHKLSLRMNNSVRLHIGSSSLVNDIEKYGIFNNKSLTIGPIVDLIPDVFKGNFICGLWDGDGSCGVYKKKDHYKPYLVVSLVGTLPLLNNVLDFLEVKGRISKDRRWGPETFCLTISKQSDLKTLYEKTYKISPFSMERKRNKFLQMEYIWQKK